MRHSYNEFPHRAQGVASFDGEIVVYIESVSALILVGVDPTCQDIEVSVCRYFCEGEVQFGWAFSSMSQERGFSSTGSAILRSRSFVGVGCFGSGDWVESV